MGRLLLGMCLQDSEAGDHAVVSEQPNQPSNLMRVVPPWLGNLVPAKVFHGTKHSSGGVVTTRQPDSIAQTADAAAEDALSELNAKRAARNQHARNRQSGAVTRQHSVTATEDIFNLFTDSHDNSL